MRISLIILFFLTFSENNPCGLSEHSIIKGALTVTNKNKIMGHKLMLQPTENCVMLRACTDSSTLDIFSNLLIEVAHHILSFLSFKDLTWANAVSKRCRQLYLSNPTVSFDAISIPSCNRRRGELYNFLDTFLTNRGDNRIQYFRIRWFFVDFESPRELIDDHYRVITWIHNAIRCKVEELDLGFTMFGMAWPFSRFCHAYFSVHRWGLYPWTCEGQLLKFLPYISPAISVTWRWEMLHL